MNPGEREALERELKKRPAGEDPLKPFYVAMSVTNLDGSICGFSGEGVEGCYETEAEAVASLEGLNEDYPTIEGYVYYCVPIRKIWRGPVRSTAINGAQPKQTPKRKRA